MDYGGWWLYFHVPYNRIAITRALSPGFSVGASLSGENLFDVLIGTEERCFDPRLCCPHSPPVALLHRLYRTEQCTGVPELVTSKAVSTALTFLLSSTKVWMRVSSSKHLLCQPNYFPAFITCESLIADRDR